MVARWVPWTRSTRKQSASNDEPKPGSSETTDDTDGNGLRQVENLFRGHPPGEHPLHRNPFFIRVIREIRGFNCCF